LIKKLFIVFVLLFSFSISAKQKFLNYSTAADVFHIINALSSQTGTKEQGVIKNYWIKNNGLSSDDNKQLDIFKTVRDKYAPRSGEFDRFSLVFYKAQTVDEALRELKKFLKKDELMSIVKVMKHFKGPVSKLVSESSGFRGKAVTVEKKFKKDKVFNTYKKVMSFFGLKKNFTGKIYFLWWPKEERPSIEIVQNIIFVKIHPLSNLEDYLDEKKTLQLLGQTLFKSLPKVQRDNFEKVVFPSCAKRNFYENLSLAMSYLPHLAIKHKKKFSSFEEFVDDKKENLFIILSSQLYTEQQKARSKFYGEFPNKLKFICEQIK
jgi:ribosomal protein S21